MRNKFNIRASQVACFAQCSAGILHEDYYSKKYVLKQVKVEIF